MTANTGEIDAQLMSSYRNNNQPLKSNDKTNIKLATKSYYCNLPVNAGAWLVRGENKKINPMNTRLNQWMNWNKSSLIIWLWWVQAQHWEWDNAQIMRWMYFFEPQLNHLVTEHVNSWQWLKCDDHLAALFEMLYFCCLERSLTWSSSGSHLIISCVFN